MLSGGLTIINWRKALFQNRSLFEILGERAWQTGGGATVGVTPAISGARCRMENLLASRSFAVLWNYLNTSRAVFSTGASHTQVPCTNGVRDATYRPTWSEARRPGGRTGEPDTFKSSKCLWRNECGMRRDANRPPCRQRLAPNMPGVWTGITSR